MKHFKQFLLAVLVALASSMNTNAHDFEAVNSEGVTIYYKITSTTEQTCAVSFQGNSYNSYSNEYSGSVNIPSSVEYDGVTYSVTSIGFETFAYCSELTSVTIPNSIISIERYAFYNCSGMVSVTIPESVFSIGNWAFKGCRSLTSVFISDLVAWCNISFGTADANPLYYTQKLFLNNELLTDLDVPISVTSIGDYAFYNCSSLSSIRIHENVTSIGNNAFQNCSGLTAVYTSDLAAWCEINFESSSSNPLFYARNFYLNNEKVAELEIPNGVTSIGSDAFSSCSGLTTVAIPSSVTSIGRHAFNSCSGLISLTIPNSVTSIEDGTFAGCYGLSSLTIPNSVTSIGSWAFANCSSLKSFNIPNEVTSIGAFAFNSCRGLSSISIGNGVSSIDNYAFYDCINLKEINLKSVTPPSCGADFLSGISRTGCLIKVPYEGLDSYKNNSPWKEFQNIVAYQPLYDGENYYNLDDVHPVNINYSRTFANGNWQALFLPFDMEYSDWSTYGTVAQLTNIEDGVLVWETLGENDATIAGVPYIFKPKASVVGQEIIFSVTGKTLVSDQTINPVSFSGYTLSGTYTEKTDMASTHAYALSGGNFYYSTDETKTLKPYRIFLTVPSPSSAPIRSRIDGDELTAIEGIEVNESQNGQYYTLQGIRVGSDYKGIVVVHGKKIIRK